VRWVSLALNANTQIPIALFTSNMMTVGLVRSAEDHRHQELELTFERPRNLAHPEQRNAPQARREHTSSGPGLRSR